MDSTIWNANASTASWTETNATRLNGMAWREGKWTSEWTAQAGKSVHGILLNTNGMEIVWHTHIVEYVGKIQADGWRMLNMCYMYFISLRSMVFWCLFVCVCVCARVRAPRPRTLSITPSTWIKGGNMYMNNIHSYTQIPILFVFFFFSLASFIVVRSVQNAVHESGALQ